LKGWVEDDSAKHAILENSKIFCWKVVYIFGWKIVESMLKLQIGFTINNYKMCR
jgi:hypothetical protein